MDVDGSGLVFVACQPRSGSTLLQRMLGSHPEIHTISEPWLMLPPTYTLRENGMEAEYDAKLARTGIDTFLNDLPEGRDDYIEGMRRMYGFLYQRALEGTGANLFLDKTPRYYLILQELKEIFPQARFVLLVRNPVAVLSSILDTWVAPQWLRLSSFRKGKDLLEAPQLLVEGASHLGERAQMVQYEGLVQQPEEEMRDICHHLGLEFTSDMIEYDHNDGSWKLGDQKAVYQRSRPQPSGLEKWKGRCSHPQYWRLMNDYLKVLDEVTLDRMGYKKDRIAAGLEERKPAKLSREMTFSLQWLLNTPLERRSQWERKLVRKVSSLQDIGITRSLRTLLNKGYRKFFS